ncbi:uncharacterized protein LOC111480695 [Cucurbita maxima]|uniref:Uncharacterized protein LOC111480695 n=1 Tax=Cucurbita maxima TaxID=3661 RepID=A0A6J1J2E3_CUCMA|nr:uncharacterized protein LOC111480695 [Cucurbita maxima]
MALFRSQNLSLWISMILFLGFCSCFCCNSKDDSSIHELLRSMGLPAGLVPKQVKSYTVAENGRLEVFLDGPCMAKYENRVIFESVFSANLSYGSLIGVEGMSQEELFLWLPVKDIIVNYPTSGVVLIDIGVAHKQLSLSLFEDPPDCSIPQAAFGNRLRNQRAFESLR